jgi:broad specificity phosphatase PhoE
MDIYLVRHGQTGGNEAKRHQSEESHLTPLGKEQARQTAVRIAQYEPTRIFVSNRVRALETGQAIALATDIIPSVDEMFTELCRPSDIYGYHHRSIKSIWYIIMWYRGKAGKERCSREGESMSHFHERIKSAQSLVESQPDDARVVIVSHSIFINFFVAHLNSDQKIGFIKSLLLFTKILKIKNGSITHLSFSKDDTPAWKTISYGE